MASTSLEGLRGENVSLKQQIANMRLDSTKRASEALTERKALMEKIQALTSKNASLKQQLKHSEIGHAEALHERNTYKTSNRNLQVEARALNATIQTLRNGSESEQNRINELERTLANRPTHDLLAAMRKQAWEFQRLQHSVSVLCGSNPGADPKAPKPTTKTALTLYFACNTEYEWKQVTSKGKIDWLIASMLRGMGIAASAEYIKITDEATAKANAQGIRAAGGRILYLVAPHGTRVDMKIARYKLLTQGIGVPVILTSGADTPIQVEEVKTKYRLDKIVHLKFIKRAHALPEIIGKPQPSYKMIKKWIGI